MSEEKAISKSGLSYLWSKLKVMLAGKSDVGHNHNYSEINDPPTFIVSATSSDGVSYTGTSGEIEELKAGLLVRMIPDITSSTTTPNFNLNGLGAKNIKQRLSVNTSLTVSAANETWMVANKPVPLLYDGTQWVTITPRSSAGDIYGTLGLDHGGTGATTASEALENLGAMASVPVTESDNGKVLRVVNGAWAAATIDDAEGASF